MECHCNVPFSQPTATTEISDERCDNDNDKFRVPHGQDQESRRERRIRRRRNRPQISASFDETMLGANKPLKGILKRSSTEQLKGSPHRWGDSRCVVSSTSFSLARPDPPKNVSFSDLKLCRWNSSGSALNLKALSSKDTLPSMPTGNFRWDRAADSNTPLSSTRLSSHHSQRRTAGNASIDVTNLGNQCQAPIKPMRRTSSNVQEAQDGAVKTPSNGANIFQASVNDFSALVVAMSR
jgi:hypothetical protein